MTLAAGPGVPAAAPTISPGDAVSLLRCGHDRGARLHLRLLVVSVVRLGVAAMEAVPLLRPEVGGPAGPGALTWLVVSAVVVGLAAVAAGDVLAYTTVAVTSSGGYGPIVVLGMMLLAQVPMRWGPCGALLAGVPLTTVSLLFPSGLADTAGGRIALVVAIAVATGLGLALGHSPTPTAITTAEGDLVQVNAAMSALTDLAPGALVGRPRGRRSCSGCRAPAVPGGRRSCSAWCRPAEVCPHGWWCRPATWRTSAPLPSAWSTRPPTTP